MKKTFNAAALFMAVTAMAVASVSIPYIHTPNTVISSSKENANNQAIAIGINDHTASTSNVHGSTGKLVDVGSAQTITGVKLFGTPYGGVPLFPFGIKSSNAGTTFVIPSGVTAPADAILSATSTATITNKTIDGANNIITGLDASSMAYDAMTTDTAQDVSGIKTFTAAPVISDFSTSQHTHADATNGGTVDHTDLTNIGTNDHNAIDAHIADNGNPHSVTAAQVGGNDITTEINATGGTINWAKINKSGSNITDISSRSHVNLTDIGDYTHTNIDSHIDNTSNPHSVTKTQVGLGSVTDDKQMKAAASSTEANFAAFVGTTGDTVTDSGYSGTSFAPASGIHTSALEDAVAIGDALSKKHTQGTDGGSTSNTFFLGDAASGDKIYYINNADAAKPALKYDDSLNKWQYSNDGVAFSDIGSGGGGGLEKHADYASLPTPCTDGELGITVDTNRIYACKSNAWEKVADPAAPFTVSSPLVLAANNISMPASSSTNNGYLTSTDWNAFNNKEPAVTKGDISGASNQVSVTGGTGAVIGSGVSLALPQDIGTASNVQFGTVNTTGLKDSHVSTAIPVGDASNTAIATTIANATSLTEAINSLSSSQAGEGQTGIASWGAGTTYFTVTGGKLQVDRGGTGYIKGKKVTWVGGQQTSAIPANVENYVYIDSTGTIGMTSTPTSTFYADYIPLFEVLYDGTNYVTVREDHPYSFPTAASVFLHNNVGPVIRNGAAVTTRVSTGTGGAAGDREIKIVGDDYLEDHGLSTAIPDSAGAGVTWNFYYTNAAGKWVRYAQQTQMPMVYNNAGTVTALGTGPSNDNSIMRLYVSKDSLNSATPTYFAVIDSTVYSTTATASAAITAGTVSAKSNELAGLELAQLGYAILQNNGTSGYISSITIAKDTFRSAISSSSGTNSSSLITVATTDFNRLLTANDSNAQLAFNTIAASIERENRGLNPFFRQGVLGYSAVGGTSSIAAETTTVRTSTALKFTSSGATDYVRNDNTTIQSGTNRCEAYLYYNTSASGAVFKAYNSDGTLLNSTALLANASGFKKARVKFDCSDTTKTYHWRIDGLTAAQTIIVDDGYIGARQYNGWGAQSVTYTAGTTLLHESIVYSNSSSSQTYVLPPAATSDEKVIMIKNIGTGLVTIDANSSETIDGSLTYEIQSQYDGVTLHCNGSAWFIL